MNEQELFTRLKETLMPDLTKSDEEYSTFDCSSEEFNLYIELKCRKTHYENLMIEKSKFDRLKTEAEERNMIPVYINSTPLGVWAFNLLNLEVDWQEKDNLPATTEFENKERITKVVGFLDITKGDRLLWT